jgi:flagellar biosynthesis protein FlhA
MAIDADLSSGLINEEEAKTRRKELEDESNFFGAMDGAAKFVRGDAIAGLLITFINVIGGMIIGVAQQGLTFGEAAQTYTLLTVGDGLVSQIPALVVSTGAGLLVSKSSTTGTADEALVGQLGSEPKPLALAAVLTGALALLPGIPMLPFLLLTAVTGGLAYATYKKKQKEGDQSGAGAGAAGASGAQGGVPAKAGAGGGQGQEAEASEDENIASALAMDDIRLELGYQLLSLVNKEGARLTDQIKALRKQLAQEMGFVLPSVRIQDNLQLSPNEYVIRIKEIESGRGELRANMLLVMDPQGGNIPIAGEQTTEPTFGLPAKWVAEQEREEAMFRGFTVVDPPTVITTHLTEIVKDNMSEMLSYAETQKLLDDLDKDQQKLVSDIIPSAISVGGIQRILQNLLHERISIRDLPGILEAISEATSYTRNLTSITEHVRTRLARQICNDHTAETGYIPILTLSPQWEQAFAEAIVGDGEDKQLSMAPSRLQEFINAVRQAFERQAMLGEMPVLLTSPGIRPYVRSIVERFRPQTAVLSQNEIHPKARIKTLGQI